jgi:hypothetical protein
MSEIFIYDLTDTWNNSGNVFDAIKMNVTNTASASGSKILNLQVGGVERFTVDVDGTATATTPTSGDNSTKLATTAFVQDAFSSFQFDISNVTATWNDAGTVFTGIGLDVTDTASNANSNLMDLKVGGAARFQVDKIGYVSANTSFGGPVLETFSSPSAALARSGNRSVIIQGVVGGGVALPNAGKVHWTSADGPSLTAIGDLALERESAGVLKVTDGSTGYGNIIGNRFDVVAGGGIHFLGSSGSISRPTWTFMQFSANNNIYINGGSKLYSNQSIIFGTGSTYDVGFKRTDTKVLSLTDDSTGYGTLKIGDLQLGLDGNNKPSILSDIGHIVFRTSDFVSEVNINQAGLHIGTADGVISFNGGYGASSVGDVALERDSAGVLKITDGSTGQGDIIANSFIIDGADGVEHTIGTVAAGYLTFTRAGGTANPITFYEPEARVQLKNTGKFGWTSVSHAAASMDLALERESAGVLKVTDASTGYGKIIADGYQLNNPINSQTGTTYTAAVADAERYVQLDNAAAITVTVPSDTTANLPIGSTVTFEQTGAGTVTFAADSGVTINSRGAVLSTAGQFAVASIIKTASNTFTLTGDLV